MAQKVGVNCGSGQRPFKSTDEVKWVNVDSQSRWNPDVLCNAAQLPRDLLPDESVDYVVLHHVLEHFGCGEGAGLIREAYRVLKFGGHLLVYVPDMHALAEVWEAGQLDTQIYMTNVYGAYMGSEDDRHKWGYDRKSLAQFLSGEHPWGFVGLAQTKTLSGADIAHDWWILEMECVK